MNRCSLSRFFAFLIYAAVLYIGHIAFEMFLLNLAYRYYRYMWQSIRQVSHGSILVLLPNIKQIFLVLNTGELAHENVVLITLASNEC